MSQLFLIQHWWIYLDITSNDVGIGVNIDESVSWSNELEITCQVLSTEVDWEPMSISLMPANIFQGKTQFSFEFDFSAIGDPTLLSPEARMDCWADGMDDAGWDLVTFSNSNEEVPWLSVPLSSVGPNIELVDVSLDGIIEAGKEIRAEISVKNLVKIWMNRSIFLLTLLKMENVS